MATGPIEVLVVGFPGSRFNGSILPELEKLIAADTISVVDGLFVTKSPNGDVMFMEFEELGANHDAAALAALMHRLDALVSEEDVFALADALDPDSSAAILVFEHTWAKPFRDAIVDSGGVLVANFRVPGLVMDEVMRELEALGV